MSRQTLDFTVIKSKGTPYYKGKIRGWTNYRSTGETTRAKAEKVARRWFEESLSEKSITFGEYTNRFYVDGCPHCTRLLGEDRPISPGHISGRRGIIKNYILDDSICRIDLNSLKRNDFLDFRDRIHKLDRSNAMKNKITGTAKTILKEAVFGNIKTTKGMNYFTMRGEKKVNIQWMLYALVHNIEKLLTTGAVTQMGIG